jgi:hypothetical protein
VVGRAFVGCSVDQDDFHDGVNSKRLLSRWLVYNTFMDFKDVLKEQSTRYPLLQNADYIKLAYQSAFGAEHLLKDFASAETYFHEEFTQTKPSKTLPLVEDLGGDFLRVNFAPYQANGFFEEDLFELFLRSAQPQKGKEALFNEDIALIEEFLRQEKGEERSRAFQQDYEAYRKDGLHPLHHSEEYRQAYAPHYRLVLKEEWSLFLARL